MAFTSIPIPGRSTYLVDVLEVLVSEHPDGTDQFTIRYAFKSADGAHMIGEIVFRDVFEYRWIDLELSYSDFPEDHQPGIDPFGLTEILESSYKENALSKCMYSQFTGNRFGGYPVEDELRFYIISFDERGRYQVLARSASTNEYPGVHGQRS